ncbi:MAG: hypothetical protein GY822_02090 [Deltaproteobacteria bacterium]|nr:hypothetical protein [Deltaproteobacteria bacterium]
MSRPFRTHFLSGVVALLLVALTTSCFSFRGQLPGALRNDLSDDQVQAISSFEFEEESSTTYYVHGLFGATDPDELERLVLKAAKE